MSIREDGLTGELEAIAPFENETAMALVYIAQELSRRNQIEARRNKMLDDFFMEFINIFREMP